MRFLFSSVKLPWICRVNVTTIIWFVLAFVAVLAEALRNDFNNYLIFKGVFWHSIDQINLYAQYPAEYFDSNHYGPLFALVIAPFAWLPDRLGVILWSLCNAWVLFYAVKRLSLSDRKTQLFLLIIVVEMMTSTHNVQFNPMMASWIILAYVLVEEEKDFWATLFIAAGFLVKLYGIGAILFFGFSRHKLKFILSFLFWMVVLFCLPMIISSPSFVIQSYWDWKDSLIEKDNKNVNVLMGLQQDISVMGIFRRVSGVVFSSMYIVIPAALMIALPLLRFRNYAVKNFRLSYLAIVLMSVVIFSSAAESATYIIALPGVAIWFLINDEKNKWNIALLLFVVIFTTLSATDLCPRYILNNFIKAYSIKALPVFIVWLVLIAQVGWLIRPLHQDLDTTE